MTQSARVDCELRTAFPASLQAVEEFLVEFRRRSEATLNRVNSFAAELLAREALTNAVVHGCHADPSKQIHCILRLRLKGRRLLIAVRHEGDGFDWRAAGRNPVKFSDCSGRGLGILRGYASRVRYSAQGNLVTIVKRF